MGFDEYSFNGKKFILPLNVYPLSHYLYRRYDEQNDKRKDELLIYGSDGYIYSFKLWLSEFTAVKINELQFTSKPFSACYRYNDEDVILFSSKESGLKIYKTVGNVSTVINVDGAPCITDMCIHYERLFVTTGKGGSSLWFSDDFDPCNWYVSLEEGGFIDLQDNRGEMLKVISFLDCLYVFREYGVTRVSAYADQTQFSASNLFLSHGKIYGDTVKLCGDCVIYLTSEGFYKFNGIDTVKILTEYEDNVLKIDNSEASAEYYNGKYYILCKAVVEGKIEKIILVYNIKSKEYYILKNTKIISMSAINGEKSVLLFCKENHQETLFQGRSGQVLNKPLKKMWKCGITDFGINSNEIILQKIKIYTEGEIMLTVESERDVKTQTLCKKGYSIANFYVKGTTFSITIVSENVNALIAKPTIYFGCR